MELFDPVSDRNKDIKTLTMQRNIPVCRYIYLHLTMYESDLEGPFNPTTGCYFTKYCREMCDKLSLSGWVKNSRTGSIVGKIQGERDKINEM